MFRALYMGVLAQLEDRLASFLAKTESELGARLEGLKQIFRDEEGALCSEGMG